MSILNVNKINPVGGGSTITIAGIASVTNNISVGNSVTATTFYGDGSNLTSLPAQATIANNADNRVITGGSSVNLNGESGLTFDGTTLTVAGASNATQAIFSGTGGSGSRGLEIKTESGGAVDEVVIIKTRASGTTGAIKFQTNGANSLELAGNGGDVTVKQGNLKFGIGGKGIDFSSTGDASGVTSELLDDYEEGTWTATLSGHSSPTNVATNNPTTTRAVTGTYRKIGSLVHVQALWTGLHQGQSNDMSNHQLQHITGIPFTSGNASGTSVFTAPLGYSRGIYGRYNNSIIEECVLYFWMGTASTTVYLQASQIVQNSPGTLYHTVSNSSSSMYYAFNMTYHTN